MKTFSVIVMTLMVLLWSSVATAYEVGDNIWAAYVCKSEEAMLQLAEVDAKDTDEAGLMMQWYFKSGECTLFMPSGVPVSVVGILIEYVDSKGVHTQVLELVGGKDQDTTFYTLATVEPKDSL